MADLENKITPQEGVGEKKNTEAEQAQKEVKNATETSRNDLKEVEVSVQSQQVKTETQGLNTQLEVQKFETMPLTTYTEMVKGTPLEQKMLKVLANSEFNNESNYPDFKNKTPEQRAEYLFRKINTGISRFYARKLGIETASPVPEYLSKVLVPASERFLMDMLRGGQDQNVNFLGSMNEVSLESLSQLFMGIKGFAESFTVPYGQAKKLMMIADFFALPQQKGILNQLKNPYDFYEKVMKNPIWDKQDLDIKTLKVSDFGLLDFDGVDQKTPEQLQQLLDTAKEQMRSSIGSIAMVENPETVKKLYTLVNKTDTFFTSTDKIATGLMDSLDQFGAIDATLQSFGINVFGSLKESKFLGGVLNFVLGLLGFSGGIEGLERSRRRRQIDRQLNAAKKSFVSEVLSEYTKNKGNSDFSQSVISSFGLKIDEKETTKFNIDLGILKTTLLEKLSNGNQINLSLLQGLPSKNQFVETVKNHEGKDELRLKSDFLTNESAKNAFVDEYLKIVLPKMAGNKDFMKTVESADELAFALTAGVCVDADMLMMGMQVDSILPNEFFAFPVSAPIDSQQEPSNLDIHKYQGKLMLYDELKIPDAQKPQFKTKLEEVSKNLNINPNWLMAVMKKESGLNPGAQNDKTQATGLIQIMPRTASELGTSITQLHTMSALEQLDYVEKYYKGDTYTGLKDLYLKTFFPAAIKYSNDPTYVFQTNHLSAAEVAKANPGIAKNDNQITMQDFNDYIAGIVNETVPNEFRDQFA